MKDLFSIGEVARMFDINAKTLRYYDETGLLKPEKINAETGYRYYSTRQFERLNTILYLRALQIPLERISYFFQCKDTDTMIQILRSQQKEIQIQMHRLQTIEKKLSSRISQIEDAKNCTLDSILLKSYPERPVFFLKKEFPVTDDLEYPIRELEKACRIQSGIFLGKIGVSISETSIRSSDFSNFSGIFLMLEPEDHRHPDASLPAGMYLTIRFPGTHTQSSLYYSKLLEHMKNCNLSIFGNSVEITLIDDGMTDDVDQFVTEIQIPVIPSE
ncbi:MerR family transcriptional regulator [Ruminococcus sp. OA3]|uniref:MerR family transcriptional regulator n=1 Tax=Ruminococcus sp. OA3 TaxID=2914164 RepID=UPI001F069CED|nr:MerR family transcriptional regulator [Ruminococcus sp. OA3]MCH1983509.1 MerR family transcriptional regulator [Ruminococcus sp. OA3]